MIHKSNATLTYKSDTGVLVGRHPVTNAPIFAPTTALVFSAYLEDDAGETSEQTLGASEAGMTLEGRLLTPKTFPANIRVGTDLQCVIESATVGQIKGVFTLMSAARSPFGLESVFGQFLYGKFKETR